MFCPVCEDPTQSASPSASMNAEDGIWNCLKGNHGGSIYALAQDLKRERGFDIRGAFSTSRGEVARSPRTPLEDQNKPLEWHDNLADLPEQIDWALEFRGVTFETLARAHVGHNGQAWTFPARTGARWMQTKFIQYPANGSKKVTQTPGARAMLWPMRFVQNEPTLPVLLCEGEWDALLADQESAGKYVAITGTGGAGTPPDDLSRLARREVFVCYDADDAGREGARKIAERLRAEGARVHVLDLTRLGLPSSSSRGADISDFFLQHGGDADKLAVEMERLRNAGDDLVDNDVLRGIESLFLANDDEQRTTLIDKVRSDEDIASMNPARYVIEGWLPVGFFTVFFGEPGSKKTFVILDMLRTIRAGLPWHGHDVTAGAALLFEGEGLEQLQARIVAWDEHHDNPALLPGGSLDDPVDMTTPQGVASVVRTVRDFEELHDTEVAVVAFDPLVEYMNGEENGDGMELATRGLRALARYLDIAVVVGAHTNASGERARGSDHLRMRSGAHIRVEALGNALDLVGLVQEKQKNGERRALQLLPVPLVRSLALEDYRSMSAAEYWVDKSGAEREERRTVRLRERAEISAERDTTARDLILSAVREQPGISQRQLLDKTVGSGVGSAALLSVRDALVAEGLLVTSTGARQATLHHLADAQEGDAR